MSEIALLKKTLKSHFNWHGARIDFLAKFIIAILQVRTVNLTQIAIAFSGKAKLDSNYKRLQRFFSEFPIDYSLIAKLIASLFLSEGAWTLCLDRTNWKFGKLNRNILFLAVAHEGVSYPLLWCFLEKEGKPNVGKKGNSNTGERITLIMRFLKLFPDQPISCITADREFIGDKWIHFLKQEGIPFRIRIRNNTRVTNSKGKTVNAYKLFREFRYDKPRCIQKKCNVMGTSLYIIGVRIPSGYVIIVTNHRPAKALEDYSKRWEIETMFGCLKSRGFNLEDTHLEELERLNKLVALVSITFCWCYCVGDWYQQKEKIKIKTYKSQAKNIFSHGKEKLERRAKSIFRHGFDFLSQILLNRFPRKADFLRAIQFFVLY